MEDGSYKIEISVVSGSDCFVLFCFVSGVDVGSVMV